VSMMDPLLSSEERAQNDVDPEVVVACLWFWSSEKRSEWLYHRLLKIYNRLLAFFAGFIIAIFAILTLALSMGFVVSLMLAVKAKHNYNGIDSCFVIFFVPMMITVAAIVTDQAFDLFFDVITQRVPFPRFRTRIMAATVAYRWGVAWNKLSFYVDLFMVVICSVLPTFVTILYTGTGEFWKGLWVGVFWAMFLLVVVYLLLGIVFQIERIKGGGSTFFRETKDAIADAPMNIGSMCTLWIVLGSFWLRGIIFVFLQISTWQQQATAGNSTLQTLVPPILAVLLYIIVTVPLIRLVLIFEFKLYRAIFYGEDRPYTCHLPYAKLEEISQGRPSTVQTPAETSCCARFCARLKKCFVATFFWLLWGAVASHHPAAPKPFQETVYGIKVFLSIILATWVILTYAWNVSKEFVGISFWASLFCCIGIAVTFCFGNFTHLQYTDIVTPDMVNDAQLLMQRLETPLTTTEWHHKWPVQPYPLCEMTFGHHEGGVSALELGVLSWYAYSSKSYAEDLVDRSFNDRFTYTAYVEAEDRTNHNLTWTASTGGALVVRSRDATVIAFRGTHNFTEVDVDMSIYTSITMLQKVNNFLLPLLYMVPKEVTGWFLRHMSSQILDDLIEHASKFVKDVKKDAPEGNTVILTGHSLGGMIAQLVGIRLGLSTLVFSAPGFQWASSELDRSLLPENASKYIVVIPRYDPIPRIDFHPGVVQNIECRSNTGWAPKGQTVFGNYISTDCHSIVRTVCELWRTCGSHLYDVSDFCENQTNPEGINPSYRGKRYPNREPDEL